MKRLTRRFIINSLDGLSLSEAIRYERYYINDNLRIQRKNVKKIKKKKKKTKSKNKRKKE